MPQKFIDKSIMYLMKKNKQRNSNTTEQIKLKKN